ncbi:hypothetical protein HPB48_001613 [Haemaphysalis longicornis]|uniref:Serine protease HTRA2, mitochondrial n=1 Tax=Haemaphysalis longicornis TaxID=44386 RepID=A0A9J6F6T5_HAELO|nr:hypothetical protein HPB48_001613 [Haemaphysalis longicornis]
MHSRATAFRLSASLCRKLAAGPLRTAAPVSSVLCCKLVHSGHGGPKGARTSGLSQCVVGAGAVLSAYLLWKRRSSWLPQAFAATVPPPPSSRFNFIADAVEKCAPAVVYIEILGRHPFTQQEIAVSNGSGFIVRSDGLILTNAHVVADGRLVTVKLHDGQQFTGKVEAIDRRSDLATVRIPAEKPAGAAADAHGAAASRRVGGGHGQPTGSEQHHHGWRGELGAPLQQGAGHPQRDGLHPDGRRHQLWELGRTPHQSGWKRHRHQHNEGHSWNLLCHPCRLCAHLPGGRLQKRPGGGVDRPVVPWHHDADLTPSLILELQQRDAMFPHVHSGVLIWRVMLGSPANL